MKKTAKTPKTEGYLRIGDVLRDALLEDFKSIGWEGDDTDGVPYATRAAKVMAALQSAAPYRNGYLIDVHGWKWQDYDFLRDNLVSVEEDEGHSATSRGMSFGNTLIARQIRALKEKL